MYRSGKRARAVEWKVWKDAPQPCEARALRAKILLLELVPLTTVLLSQMGQMDMEIEKNVYYKHQQIIL